MAAWSCRSHGRSSPGEPSGTLPFSLFFDPAAMALGEKNCFSGLVMPDPWRKRKQDSPARRRFLVEQPQAAANGFSQITKPETRNTAFPVARLVPAGTEALQSCFFGRNLLWVESDDAVAGNRKTHPRPSGTRRLEMTKPPKPLLFRYLRDPRHETRPLPGARRKPARIPRLSRITRHETRITAFFRPETRLFRGSLGTCWY